MTSLAVYSWPGATPAPQDGLFAILICTSALHHEAKAQAFAANVLAANADAPSSKSAGGGALSADQQRGNARRQLRLAARYALAAVLRMPADDISIASRPGEPPSILLAGRPSTIGISFSHDDHYSLAAINLHGPIGADIMRIQDIPDWHAVARDYLDPTTAAALQALPAAERAQALTQAWTQREAALKYHAQQLSEWQTDLPGQAIPLILPVDGLAGYIHIGDNNA